MNYILIILTVFVIKIRSDWRLEWNDEFDSEEIDLDKWQIYERDDKKCDRLALRRLNCYTNSSRNIRMINGTVAITAIPEKIKNKEYTSGFIKTRKILTYGKIEMRAALQLGKLLSPWLKLVPFWARNRDGAINNNQVTFLTNDQTDNIRHSVSLGKKLREYETYLTEGDLNEFHIYEIMWNRTHIIWKFDGLETFNWYNEMGSKTFLDRPTFLTIYVKVGGTPFLNEFLTPEDVSEWENPSFILDYIRYYQWTDQIIVNNHSNLKNTNASAIQLNKAILSETRLKWDDTDYSLGSSSGSNFIIIAAISTVCLLLFLLIIVLIVWLVIWMRKIKKTDQSVPENEYYDDINGNNIYEDVNKYENYDHSMAAQYLQIESGDNNGYIEPEPSHKQLVLRCLDQHYNKTLPVT